MVNCESALTQELYWDTARLNREMITLVNRRLPLDIHEANGIALAYELLPRSIDFAKLLPIFNTLVFAGKKDEKEHAIIIGPDAQNLNLVPVSKIFDGEEDQISMEKIRVSLTDPRSDIFEFHNHIDPSGGPIEEGVLRLEGIINDRDISQLMGEFKTINPIGVGIINGQQGFIAIRTAETPNFSRMETVKLLEYACSFLYAFAHRLFWERADDVLVHSLNIRGTLGKQYLERIKNHCRRYHIGLYQLRDFQNNSISQRIA